MDPYCSVHQVFCVEVEQVGVSASCLLRLGGADIFEQVCFSTYSMQKASTQVTFFKCVNMHLRS